MKRFLVRIKKGSVVIAEFEAMSESEFACVIQHMETAELLGGRAVAYPVEGK